MRQFGLIQRNNHNEHADSETCDRATGIEVAQVLGTSLKTATENEGDGSHHDGKTTTKDISEWSSESSTEEGAASEDRDNCTAGRMSVRCCGMDDLLTYVSFAVGLKSAMNDGAVVTPAMTPRS